MEIAVSAACTSDGVVSGVREAVRDSLSEHDLFIYTTKVTLSIDV